MPATPNRRIVLGAGAALALGALTGCGVNWRQVRLDDAASPTPPTLTRDDLARFAAVGLITTLQAQAGQIASHPPAQNLAAQVAAAHATHLRALGPIPGPVPSASPTPSGWPTPATTTAPELDPIGLANAEAAAATTLLTGLDELSGRLAALFVSIACCCLQAGSTLVPGRRSSTPPAPPASPAGLTAPSPDGVSTAVLALIAADDAAGYAYGPYAAALNGPEQAQAVTRMQLHTQRSLQVRALAGTARLEVPAAPAAYAVTRPGDATVARQACGRLEAACARAASALLSTGNKPGRALGQLVLRDGAAAQAAWTGLVALPGR